MADDYIRKADVLNLPQNIERNLKGEVVERSINVEAIKALPSADVIPYSIESDGTLIITVPKGTYKNLNRVLVEEDGTHWGGLYYAD